MAQGLEQDMVFDTWTMVWACNTEQREEQELDASENQFEFVYGMDADDN